MRAWFTMTCGNSDKPSSVSWTRPVRSIRERSCLRRAPEDGLVHPVGLADELLAQAEGLEHFDRAAGDAVGLAYLERAVATLDEPRADAWESRQLCRQQRPSRTAADDEDVDGVGRASAVEDVGVAGLVAIQIELHVASFAATSKRLLPAPGHISFIKAWWRGEYSLSDSGDSWLEARREATRSRCSPA